MRFTKILLFVVLWIFSSSAIAQEAKKPVYFIGSNAHYGYMLSEYQFINLLVKEPITSFGFTLGRYALGNTKWDQIYNYPEIGISYFYSTLGNDEQIGRGHTIYPWVSIRYINKENYRLKNKFGLSIGYVSKKFDVNDNYQNIAMGSYLNVFFDFGIINSIRVYNRLWFNAGMNFAHMSSANLAQPNIGLNWLTFFGGFSYSLGDEDYGSFEPGEHNDRFRYSVIPSIGARSINNFDSKKYLTSSISANASRLISYKIGLGGGCDIFYDNSTKVRLANESNTYNIKTSDYFKSGIHISQEFVVNKFSFSLNEGVYMVLPDKVTEYRTYTRAAFRYRFDNNIIANVALKTHFFKMDFLEFGVGYYFESNEKE